MRAPFPSIIKARRDSIEETQARKDWAKVTGVKEYPKPTYYENIKTGEKYYHIAGAIGWPWQNIPGYALVVGVNKTDDESCKMTILEEIEDSNVQRLLLKCVGLRDKYGYWEDSSLMRYFFGDDTRYNPISLAVCFELRRKDGNNDEHGFWIYSPDDFEEKDHFETYLRQVLAALTPDEAGKKLLIIGNNPKIKNYIQTLSNDSITHLEMRQKAKEYPAMFALGALVHTLLQRKPWMANSGGEAFNLED